MVSRFKKNVSKLCISFNRAAFLQKVDRPHLSQKFEVQWFKSSVVLVLFWKVQSTSALRSWPGKHDFRGCQVVCGRTQQHSSAWFHVEQLSLPLLLFYPFIKTFLLVVVAD